MDSNFVSSNGAVHTGNTSALLLFNLHIYITKIRCALQHRFWMFQKNFAFNSQFNYTWIESRAISIINMCSAIDIDSLFYFWSHCCIINWKWPMRFDNFIWHHIQLHLQTFPLRNLSELWLSIKYVISSTQIILRIFRIFDFRQQQLIKMPSILPFFALFSFQYCYTENY